MLEVVGGHSKLSVAMDRTESCLWSWLSENLMTWSWKGYTDWVGQDKTALQTEVYSGFLRRCEKSRAEVKWRQEAREDTFAGHQLPGQINGANVNLEKRTNMGLVPAQGFSGIALKL